MKKSGVWVVLSASLALLLTLSGAVFAVSDLVILHTNDIHGRLESHQPWGAEHEKGGLVRLAYFVEELREQYGNRVLLLDAGDTLHGTNLVNLFHGIPAIEVMEAMGYAAMAIGNHEFNFGQDILKQRMEEASFPFLSANVVYEDGSAFAYSATIQDIAGFSIGIVGLTADETPIQTHPKGVEGLRFLDSIETAKRVAPSIREEVDILIALTHIGYDKDKELALAVPEFDIIVGGHSHSVLEQAEDIGGTLVVQAHEYGNYLGVLKLQIENGRITGHESELLPVTHETPKSSEIQVIVDGWNELLAEQLGEVVADSRGAFDGERAHVRTQETNLGNLVTDILRDFVGAQAALINGGNFRASLHPGPVTVGDIYTVLPFDNAVVLLEVSGAELLDALEHSVRAYPDESGGFMQVSGIYFELNAAEEPGNRVDNVWVYGEPLEMDARYSLVTNDFIAAGGDGYTMLAEAKVLTDTGIGMKDVIVEYFRQVGSVTPDDVLGRIVVVD